MNSRKPPAQPYVVNWTAWGTFAAALMPLTQVSPPLKLFDLVALFFGGMFFLYALKYYLSMALILVANGGGNGNGKGKHRNGPRNGNGNGYGLRGLPRNGDEAGEPAHQPFISIHLPLYNEAAVVDRLLQSCTALNYENYEVVVADDSTDETSTILDQRWASHSRVKISKRRGRSGFKGGAQEKALQVTGPLAEFIVVFDADFIPPPDILQQFLAYDGSCVSSQCSSLDTPVVTVPESGLVFAGVAVRIPVTVGRMRRKNRLAQRARSPHDPFAHSRIRQQKRMSTARKRQIEREKRP